MLPGLITYLVYALPRAVLGANLHWSPHVPELASYGLLRCNDSCTLGKQQSGTYKSTARNTEFFLLSACVSARLGYYLYAGLPQHAHGVGAFCARFRDVTALLYIAKVERYAKP